jgi:hypothetical protein
MNKNLRKLYVAIQDDKVLFAETNLKSFVERLKQNDSGTTHSRNWFSSQFNKHPRFRYLSQSNNLYWLQKVI